MARPFTIPEELVRTVLELNGAAGRNWLDRLPAIVDDCARRWSLTMAPAFRPLTYNYAAPGVRADGAPVVLKVCFPSNEFFTEAEALRIFAGQASVRLLAADLDQGALLLERLLPGTTLSDAVRDDERATEIAADLMLRIRRPAPPDHRFRTVSGWVERMGRLAPDLLVSQPTFPAAWIDRSLVLFQELMAESDETTLLHGDLHHTNILAAEREPWLTIDPKGVVGDPLSEIGPLLLNALPDPLEPVATQRLLQRRLAQLAELLAADTERLRAWGIVRAVLSAFWSLEDHGYGWEGALLCAQLLSDAG